MQETLRATPEGRNHCNEYERSRRERDRATPEDRNCYNESQRLMQERLRARPEVRINYNESVRQCQERQRSNKKSALREELENDTFPPVIDEDHKITCLENFIKATAPDSLATFECAVCRESVHSKDYDTFMCQDLPNNNLISVEESNEINF